MGNLVSRDSVVLSAFVKEVSSERGQVRDRKEVG